MMLSSKKQNAINIRFLLGILIFTFLTSEAMSAETKTAKVEIAAMENGGIEVKPPIPTDGLVEIGTTITITATPVAGFMVDSVYHTATQPWNPYYFESMSEKHQFTVTGDTAIGALFVPTSTLDGIEVVEDVVYAKPGVKTLKYDVFKPKTADNLPLVIIIHGGGWRANTEDIMRGMARYIAKTEKYVVASIDYRWISTLDGDAKENTMDYLISDVFGAIAHIQEHAVDYGADPTRIAVTGDSAGGHLSAVAATMIEKIGDGGFGKKEGRIGQGNETVFEFLPSYLPPGKTVVEVREALLRSIKVAAPSYGVFSGIRYGQSAPTEWNNALSPINFIPDKEVRSIPHFMVRGTEDRTIPKAEVVAYAEALKAKGQVVKHIEVEGAAHAFFDWKPDPQTRDVFVQYGEPYLVEMMTFFDKHLRKD